ncbi:MAG: nucleotidyltransferase domain-containing protein [Candidatus Hatepunaea meridiana]|nr:nucleotidyltransferase domain-containing protein [Candidatus Hatepunaea meridiana]
MNTDSKKIAAREHDIARRIVEAVQPTKIYLFGSRARGDHREDSDVDLLVIYDGLKSKETLQMEIRRIFRPRTFSLDLFIMSSEELELKKHIANTLAREISENGVVVYG